MCTQPNRPLSIYPKARALPFHPLFLPLFKNELKLLFEFELLSQKGCCEKGQVICIYYIEARVTGINPYEVIVEQWNKNLILGSTFIYFGN